METGWRRGERYTRKMESVGHVPVLPREVVEVLEPRAGDVLVDGTLGRGGHGSLIVPRIGPGGRYVGLDVDPANAAFARERVRPIAEAAGVRLDVVHGSFTEAEAALADLGITRVNGVLADLGFASNQMDDAARGFSFGEDGPLDMRLDPTAAVPTAANYVNETPEGELADLIYELGEERFSRRVARKIVEVRQRQPITTTSELAEVVYRAYGPMARSSRMHPATRTFMALRIAVNDELRALDALLDALPRLLAAGGRAAIISFHSLEDRRVKQRFVEWEKSGLGERITRKPVGPGDEELAINPRSRSAKLRAFRWG